MFEFDLAKSAANKAKHGIDFEGAQALWLDPGRAEAGVVSHGGEERHILVGRIGERLWTAVVTYRGGRIRLISVRRARKVEQDIYLGRGV